MIPFQATVPGEPEEGDTVSIVENKMSPQAHTYSQPELRDLAEREARDMLGVSWDEATRQLATGALAGTAAEAELRMLQFLLGS